ncbi:siderophore-interacting protein [Duganella sp. FT80W]|uniref:Siderophore-interacting protein n=1 Tax=Duganella guangzhouensis TaxID=2666084 RepID=A0A6I2KZ97_9BURK|nr:siderophore-interacting protein [Duganella guangzhouensis]MRW90862.1 siderophore-interacting protein [Duganella guangzhouensis]
MNTHTPAKRAGLIETAFQKLLTRSAQVVEVEDIGSNFRLVTLAGDDLCGVDWTPGDKIQVSLAGWVRRTYTPIDWDAVDGRTRILIYLHGDAPGTRWARTLRAGDNCAFFGPRKSVRLAPSASPVILSGDETALGLAAALASQASLHMLCEVSARADVMAVIDRLQLEQVQLVGPGESAAALVALLRTQPMADLVLTGQGGAIQQISRQLRTEGVDPTRRQSKAYWVTGKTGLD